MSTLRTALEAALAANPDDLATHMAYADHLTEQGDPRGEFIQVQLALETSACSPQRRDELKCRERELLDAHERTWLGDLTEHLFEKDINDYQKRAGLVSHGTWWRGWLEEVYLWKTEPASLQALAKCPIARLLQRLDLGQQRYEDNDDSVLNLLAQSLFLEHLRFFRRGEKVDFSQDYHNCTTSGAGVVDLVSRMPNLEELQLLVLGTDMRRLFALPNLTKLGTLVVYHEREVYPLEVLATNPAFDALETLRLHPAHCDEEDGYLPLRAVSPLFHPPYPLFDSRHLPALKHLHLYASSIGDAGCEEIVRSGILRQLYTLDLMHGRVTDAGARILAASPDIRHLRYLSLDRNQLSTEGVALLQELSIPEVRLGRQEAVGSDEYLMTGNME